MPSYRALLQQANENALAHGREASAMRLLMLHLSKLTPAEMAYQFNEEADNDFIQIFEQAVQQHLVDKMPVQYIVGHDDFFGHRFIVNPSVFIPRMETEELVEQALLAYDTYYADTKRDVVDIGTGSGCIAITLALEEPNLKVSATDISDQALKVAKENATRLGANVTFYQGSLFEPLEGKMFDMIISNPPYIPDQEVLDELITDHEPHQALFGGVDGLDPYRIILAEAKNHLKPCGLIAFEHGYDQAREIQSLAKEMFPKSMIHTIKDMQGKERMTFIKDGE